MKNKRIHLIAACGMGMGPLAGLLKEKGYEVTGSDANPYPPMSDQFATLGIRVKNGYSPENLEPTPDLVVIGNAVSKTNPEVAAVLERKIPYLSMPQAVEELFLKGRSSIVVAGTHGKTTTTALAAWILEKAGRSPGLLVGGILKNLGRSYQLGRGDLFVIEGDEYDSAFFDKEAKFFHYHPKWLILNPVEFDHADIYRDLDHLMSTFRRLIQMMPPQGVVAAAGDSPNVQELLKEAPCRIVRVGLTEGLDLVADRLEFAPTTRFRLLQKGKELGVVTSPLLGRHNVQNLLGVIAIALDLGLSLPQIQEGIASFQGVKRRQEMTEISGILLIDDFAHHPTAIRETLAAIRARYPERRLWALFEPRSNTTRRNVFQKEFPEAFDAADEVLLAPLYLPEKIPDGERLDVGKVAAEIRARGKKAHASGSIEEIIQTLIKEAQRGDIICMMSNGSFGGMGGRLIQGFR